MQYFELHDEHSGKINLAEFVSLTLAIMQFAEDEERQGGQQNSKKSWGMPADKLEDLTDRITQLQASFSLYVKEQSDAEESLRVSDVDLAEFSR